MTIAKTAAETEKIISRLHAEAEEERAKIKKNFQNESDTLRSKAQIAIDAVKNAEMR